MSSTLFRPLLIAAVLALAACSNAPPDADAVRYHDIELHLGAYAPVDTAPAHTPVPGERDWTTREGSTVHLAHALTIPGADIQSITVGTGDTPTVDFALTSNGSAEVLALTSANVGKALGIVADDTLLSAATIRGPFGDAFQVSAISPEQARTMVDTLTDTQAE